MQQPEPVNAGQSQNPECVWNLMAVRGTNSFSSVSQVTEYWSLPTAALERVRLTDSAEFLPDQWKSIASAIPVWVTMHLASLATTHVLGGHAQIPEGTTSLPVLPKNRGIRFA